MAVAYGLFCLGLVLGWSALFLDGSTLSARLGQLLWLAVIVTLSLTSFRPGAAIAGVLSGGIAHCLLFLGLEGRRA